VYRAFIMDVWTLRYFLSFYSVCPVAILVLGMCIPYNGMREVERAYLHSQCFKVQWFCFQPTQCIYVFCVDLRTNSCFVWISGQIAIIPLYNIN